MSMWMEATRTCNRSRTRRCFGSHRRRWQTSPVTVPPIKQKSPLTMEKILSHWLSRMMDAALTLARHTAGWVCTRCRNAPNRWAEVFRWRANLGGAPESWSRCQNQVKEGGVMSDQNEPITVMIVDDHEMVRRGASSYLEAQPDISLVAQAGSGAEAVRLAQEFIPDVVLMDLVMPDMDGVEATRRVKSVSPRTQVVILTSFHQDEYVFPALQAGAISYLLKDVKATELLEAIRRAARGEAR